MMKCFESNSHIIETDTETHKWLRPIKDLVTNALRVKYSHIINGHILRGKLDLHMADIDVNWNDFHMICAKESW